MSMGVNDRARGEYMVRLWLDQFAESGEVCSNAVDLLGLVSEGGIAAAGRVDAIRLSAGRPDARGLFRAPAVAWRTVSGLLPEDLDGVGAGIRINRSGRRRPVFAVAYRPADRSAVADA